MARPIADEPKRQVMSGDHQDMHVWIKREVRRRARIYAAENDMSLSAVVQEALEEYLSRHAGE